MKIILLMLLLVVSASPVMANSSRANRAEPAITCETVRAYVSQVAWRRPKRSPVPTG